MTAETLPSAYYAALPPSVADDPVGYAWSLFGLMTVTLIFAQWSYRSAWQMIDLPERYNHPRTVLRVVLLLTGLSGVIRNGPDVLSWGLWKVTSPHTRFMLSHWNRILDGVSGPPQTVSWILLSWGITVIEFQLGKQPIPVELYPGAKQMARPISLVIGVMALCLAIAFMR